MRKSNALIYLECNKIKSVIERDMFKMLLQCNVFGEKNIKL